MRLPPTPAFVAGAALFCAPLLLPLPADAQEEGFGIRPSRWTLEMDLGAKLPGTVYNEFLERSHPRERLTLRTRWKERNEVGLEGRATLRFRPEMGAGLYLAGVWGRTGTLATFTGGITPPEEIDRTWTYRGFDAGITMKLKDWDQGRGLLEYSVGAILLQQTIDLSAGHRDPLATFPSLDVAPQEPLAWSDRTFTNWGLSLAGSFRVPLREGLAFRTTFRDVIIPVNTAALAQEEETEVQALSGERGVQFTFSGFTAHHITFSIGLEYTLGWGQPRREVVRRVPGGVREVDVDESVLAAMRLAAEGDTAAAVAALEHRVSVEPADAYAWRELALLKTARAEIDPTVRDEVLATLERALNLNPGDTELLRAYGRVRGLVQREGRLPEGDGAEPLALSDLAVAFSQPRDIRVAWAIGGLSADEEGAYRYRVRVEAFREDGEPLELRSGLDRFTLRDDGSLEMEGIAEELPANVGASFFIVEPRPGIHTVRVWVTDLITGQRTQTAEAFEIPMP